MPLPLRRSGQEGSIGRRKIFSNTRVWSSDLASTINLSCTSCQGMRSYADLVLLFHSSLGPEINIVHLLQDNSQADIKQGSTKCAPLHCLMKAYSQSTEKS
jgi:hypothetical protein